MQELDERCARSGPSCDPRRNVNLTGGAPICFGETIIDGQVPDEFIEDFLARKIRRILGESPKAAHTKPCGAGCAGSVEKTEMSAGPFDGHSCLRPVSGTRHSAMESQNLVHRIAYFGQNLETYVATSIPSGFPVSSGLGCRRQLRAEVVPG
jgi:hypothetical protein